MESFADACRHVRRLPYGYNSDRDVPMILFKENKGSCATKHAAITALAGELGRPITSAGYASAKAGILGFTMSVARSVAPYGINVNAVCPGIIITEIHQAFSDEQLEALQADIPLNRGGVPGVRGRPQDISDAVLFLASSESDYITGTRIRVNGGSQMG